MFALALFLAPPAHAQNARGTGNLSAAAVQPASSAGLVLSETDVTVPEEGTAAYTVKLATKPSGTVLVTVARKSSGQQDTDLSVKTGASLYFSPRTWNTPRYVFLQADDDTDALHGTAVFVHTASGADYGGVSAELTATEADDEVALVLSKTKVRVPESGTETYTVKLKSLPSASVTVAVARKSGGDTNLSVKTGASLTFTTTDWDTEQTVTLQASEDTDDDNGRAVFTHTASGGQYTGASAALTAIEAENELGMTISPANVLKVPEAGTWAYYHIRLNTQPSADVTVTMAKTGDQNLAHVIGTPMTFTMTNWNEWQTRPVSASADGDDEDGTATLTHTANGGGYVNVTAALTLMEVDKDRKFIGVSDSVNVAEGGSTSFKVGLFKDPAGTVTVTVTKKAGAHPSLAVDTDPNTAGNQNTFTLTKSYLPSDPEGHGTIKVIAGEDDDSANFAESDAFTITAAGSGYDGLSKSFGVNVTDNDIKGLAAFRGLTGTKVSPDPGEVAWVREGGTLTVPVRLASRPNGTVTVKVTGNNNPNNVPFLPPHAHPSITVDMDAGATGVQDTMTFTNLNWDVPQSMVLEAAEDNDAEHTPGSFKLAVRGTNYIKDQQLNVRDADKDAAGRTLTLSKSGLKVDEGESATYTVALASAPTVDVTVTIERTSGDTDLTADPKTLTFTSTTWSDAQTVTISAAADEDNANGQAVFTHTASGDFFTGVTALLTARETDSEAIPSQAATGEEEEILVPGRALTLSASDLTVPEGGSSSYTVALAAAPSGPVTVAVARNAGGDTDLAAAPGTLTFTTTDWSAPQTITVTAAEDDDRDAGAATFTHVASGGGYGAGANATVATLTATEEDMSGPEAQERLAQVNEAILPEMLRAVVQNKVDHVVSRIVSEILPDALETERALAAAAGMLARHGETINEGGFSWRTVLSETDVALRLSGEDDGNGADGVAFWAAGDYLHLSDDRPIEWQGELFGFHMGSDARLGPNLRAGLGLSLEESAFDYVHRASDGAGTNGTQNVTMTSVFPYAGWRLADGSNLWATIGYGRGEAEFDDSVAGRQTGDAWQIMAAAGGDSRLADAEGPLAGGESTLAVRTQAAAGRLEVDDNGSLISDTAVSAYGLRVALEGAEAVGLASGGLIEPSLEAAMRWDGGDGDTGLGLELGGGLDFEDPARGLTAGARGRALVAHESGLRGWGASGWLRLIPDDFGRGWSFEAAPSWGEADGGVEKLWAHGVADEESEDSGATPQVRFDTELGYGFVALSRRHGLLTPYAGLGLTDGGSRSYRLGARFELGATISVDIDGTRDDRASGATDHALGMNLTMRW